MPKLDAFSKLMLACGLFAVAMTALGAVVLEQVVAGPCAAGPAARLALLAVWPMLALAGGAACWALLRVTTRITAWAKRRPRPASRRLAPGLDASAAILRFPAMSLRRAAAAPRRPGLDGQVVTLRPARRAPRRHRTLAPNKPLEDECRGKC